MKNIRMCKPLAALLQWTGSALLALSRRLHVEERSEAYEQWVTANGDATHRLDYDLSANSLVFDCGGYRGQWASDIVARYCCFIHVFEPVPSFAEATRKRLERNSRVTVHPFGLAEKSWNGVISVCEEGSSLFRTSKMTISAQFFEAARFITDNSIGHIDLMKINIEGGEYALLEHLINKNLIRIIDNIQVQFHDIGEGSAQRMKIIQDQLSRTHSLTYSYPFVWENWRNRR